MHRLPTTLILQGGKRAKSAQFASSFWAAVETFYAVFFSGNNAVTMVPSWGFFFTCTAFA